MERSAERNIVASTPPFKSARQRQQPLEDLRRVITAAPFIFWVFDRRGVFTLVEGRGADPLARRRT